MTPFEIMIIVVLSVCFGLAVFMLLVDLFNGTKIGDLVNRTLDIWAQKRWVRIIEKEYERYNKYKNKAQHSGYVAKALLNRYDEIYGVKEGDEKND